MCARARLVMLVFGTVSATETASDTAAVEAFEQKCPAEGGCDTHGDADNIIKSDTSSSGSVSGVGWADASIRSHMRELWGTPVYSAQVNMSDADQRELSQLIAQKYFTLNETLSKGDFGETLPPAKVNDNFFEWQNDMDHQWFTALEECLDQTGHRAAIR